MANFFNNKKTDDLSHNILQIALFILLICVAAAFFIGVVRIERSTIDKQQESLETALERDIIQCYCLEGTYPPSLDYLKNHYGLTYDEDYFFVDYRPIASNLYPDVTILRIK